MLHKHGPFKKFFNKYYEISVFKQPYLKSGTLAKKSPYMLCDDTGNLINENVESIYKVTNNVFLGTEVQHLELTPPPKKKQL